MLSPYTLAIDLGTSGVRALVFNSEGYPVLTEQREIPLLTEETGAAELEPEIIFEQLLDVVRTCMERLGPAKSKVRAIGFSTQMHSLLAVDSDGKPLTPVMTWADSRANAQAESIKDNFDCHDLYQKTGCRVQHPLYPLSKILWLKETKPDIFRQTAKFLTIKSYLLFRLLGKYFIDYTDASATGCFNIHDFCWDKYILSTVLHISEDFFARPVECSEILDGLKPEMAQQMSLDSSIVITAGTGDGIAANLGCGIFDDKAMTSTVGTSGALRTTVSEPLLDLEQRTWCYCLTKDRWVAGGAINNGGLVLRWLRDQFRDTFQTDADQHQSRSIYALFDQYAAEVPAGSDNLIFLPLLTGERSPNWNALTRGVIFGLDLRHGRQHLVKAAMEGIVYQMNSVYQVLASFNQQTQQIRANGGYAKSDVWLQIQADIFDKPIAVSSVSEASALGAAYLAMSAIGALDHFGQALPAMAVSRIFEPDPKNKSVYQAGYQQYLQIYNKLYR